MLFINRSHTSRRISGIMPTRKNNKRLLSDEVATAHTSQWCKKPIVRVYEADHLQFIHIVMIVITWHKQQSTESSITRMPDHTNYKVACLLFTAKSGFVCEVPLTDERNAPTSNTVVETCVAPALINSLELDDVLRTLSLWRKRPVSETATQYWTYALNVPAALNRLWCMCHNLNALGTVCVPASRGNMPALVWDKEVVFTKLTQCLASRPHLDARMFTMEALERLIETMPLIRTKLLTSDLVGCMVLGELMSVLDAFPITGDTSYECKSLKGIRFLDGSIGPTSFAYCDVSDVRLVSAKMRGARFAHVHCQDSKFMGANLRKMEAYHTDLRAVISQRRVSTTPKFVTVTSGK